MKKYVHDQIDIISRSRVTVKPGRYMLLPHVNLMVSHLPNFIKTKTHILATPDVGAKFLQYELMMQPGGRSIDPINDGLEHFCFVLEGGVTLNIQADTKYELSQGGFAFLPAGTSFELINQDKESRVIWIKSKFIDAGSLKPELIVGNEKEVKQFPGQRLTPFDENPAYDMGVLIVNIAPGKGITQVETHIMQHGLYMIQGQGLYWLDGDFHEVHADDFIYMAPYCPQYFYATGEIPARYLLYKDVNREFSL